MLISRFDGGTVMLLSTLLLGCANTLGVAQLGPDTYTVGARAALAAGGSSGARLLAINEANAYCSKQGKNTVIVNIGTGHQGAMGVADVNFRCLAEGDRDLQRPEYSREPNVVIEDRRK